MSARITGLGTVVVYVSDVDRSRRFYGQLLGLHEVYEHAGRVGYQLDGGVRLLLHPAEDVDLRHGRVEIYLLVSDVDGAVAELSSHGVQVQQPPSDEPWGERVAAILDPDGYPVFLVQPLNHSWRGTPAATT